MSMNIEDLSKSQLILLVLLVSFITSIATGIVTVSLMEEAPKDVVRVVQRVVERTVEKVSDNTNQNTPKEKIIEKTIVIKEGDVLAQKIAETRDKIYAIYKLPEESFASTAFYNSGYFIADAANISDDAQYIVKNKQVNIPVKLKAVSHTRQIAVFAPESDGVKIKRLSLSGKELKLGQSVFFFTDPLAERVMQAIVSSAKDSFVEISANEEDVLPGALLFDSTGNIVAISTKASRNKTHRYFVKAGFVNAFIENVKKGLNFEKEQTESSAQEANEQTSESSVEQQASAQGATQGLLDNGEQNADAKENNGQR